MSIKEGKLFIPTLGSGHRGTNMSEDEITVYGIEDKPPLTEAIPLGLQHIFAMFLGNIAVPLIIAGAVGVSTGQTTFLVQMALIVAGVATILQAYPIGPIGAKMPIVMGTSFAFVGGLIGVGSQFGIAAVFGACLVASLVEVGIGFSIGRVRRFFPPLVTGIVVILIGLTLIPVGMDYMAGGVGAEDYGSLTNLGIGALVLVIAVGLNQFFDGFIRISSVFIAILVGYLIAVPAGLVDFSTVAEAGWVTVPRPLEFGLAFDPSAILIVGLLYVVTAIETIGDVSSTAAATGREATEDELRGGLLADAVASAFAAIFNAFPNTSYSQNVGLINFTGVASRYVAAIGGVFLIILGFIPKVGALAAAMPDAVLGGGALVMFAMIFSSGTKIIVENVTMNQRNMTILAVSVGLGLAVAFRPDALANLPEEIRTLAQSGLIMGGVGAVILNIIVPGGAVGVGEPDTSAGGYVDREPATAVSED